MPPAVPNSCFAFDRKYGLIAVAGCMNHNKIITVAAKKALAPLGLKQQRNSRIWYDDRGWWAIVVEFQPSSWDRGSYLNVAVSWMLYEHDHWTFDIGGRADKFRSATAVEGFEAATSELASHAVRLVQEYRDRFQTLDAMYAYYNATIERHGGWPDYYAGVLAGLRGDRASAEQHFTSVMAASAMTTWHRALQFRCQDLMRLLGEPEFFRSSVFGIVLRCRAGRCLEDISAEEIGLP
jgi:hypothetical protein